MVVGETMVHTPDESCSSNGFTSIVGPLNAIVQAVEEMEESVSEVNGLVQWLLLLPYLSCPRKRPVFCASPPLCDHPLVVTATLWT